MSNGTITKAEFYATYPQGKVAYLVHEFKGEKQ